MKTFAAILAIPTASTILAAKILGRVIDQCARGFGEDESLGFELDIYKCIQAKYPKDTIDLPTMFKSMVRRAKNTVEEGEEFEMNLEGMSDEEKALWQSDGEVSERKALMDAMPQITKLFSEATADPGSWDELPVIAQWSLLNKMEVGIPDKISLYKSWADKDRATGKHNTNAMRLQAEAEEAVTPVFKLVTEFLDDDHTKDALASEIDAGTNVPPRLAQAA